MATEKRTARERRIEVFAVLLLVVFLRIDFDKEKKVSI